MIITYLQVMGTLVGLVVVGRLLVWQQMMLG